VIDEIMTGVGLKCGSKAFYSSLMGESLQLLGLDGKLTRFLYFVKLL
jgi:hypothetical protein